MPRWRVLVDADDAGVLGLGEHGVAADVAVVLLGDPGLVGAVRAADDGEPVRLELRAGVVGRGSRAGVVGLQGVEVGRAGHRPLVDRALVGDGARRDVDDPLAVPVDGEPVAVGDLTDDGGEHVPLAADGEELLDLGRLDDRAHALLRLAHQDLGRA